MSPPGSTTLYECASCGRTFAAARSHQQHADALGHARVPLFPCQSCDRIFRTGDAAASHMDSFAHWDLLCRAPGCRKGGLGSDGERREHELKDCLYCNDCDRIFVDYNGVKMHLNSRSHRGANMVCPFCKAAFTSATGLCHHLERGSCPKAPQLDRDAIFRIVRERDPFGMLSKNLIGWDGSKTYAATERSWNGCAYECYLCHREFGSLASLNQHLGSPAHQQDLYHCPNRACARDFKTLAALTNHLESEACGFARFEKVQTTMRNVISGDRLLSFA